jgi:hypothetical protein
MIVTTTGVITALERNPGCDKVMPKVNWHQC